MHKKRLMQFLAVFVFVTALTWNSSPEVHNTALAQELVDLADSRKYITQLIGSEEVVYYKTTVFQRVDSSVQEPPDPYHLPILPFYNGEYVIERWVTTDGFVETTALASNSSLILQKIIETKEKSEFYDAVSGTAFKSTPQEHSTSRSMQVATPTSWISGETDSVWGGKAWVVEFSPFSTSPQEFDIVPQKLAARWQVPYAADLDFEYAQWQWQVDQDTQLLISKSLVAKTTSGPVTLYSETRDSPKTLHKSELPTDWDSLPVEAEDMVISADSPDNSSVLGSSQQPEEIAQSIDFTVYLPSAEALASMQQPLTRKIVFNENRNVQKSSPLAFEMTDASINGLGLKIIYIADIADNSESPQAFVIVQSSRSSAINRLNNSLPTWQRSKSITINIDGIEQQAWLLSGGLLREAGNNPLLGLIYETGETLVYIEGQNMSEQELRSITSTLQPVNQGVVDTGANTVFLPLVQQK